MISRHWTGIVKKGNEESYLHHLKTETFEKLKTITGFLAAQILKRTVDDGTEFLIITEWESLAAVVRFAGKDLDTAVVPEVAQKMMIRYDEKVRHYQVGYETA